IGQFNFVNSLVSPFDVRVRSATVCGDCSTRECIRGSTSVPGCETGLFVPRKSGGMDWTPCLGCIQACPHNNIGIVAVTPGAELGRDRLRSGVGRLSRRTDVAVLVLLLVFGAFINAAGMVAPILELEQRVAESLGLTDRAIVVVVLYLSALVAVPMFLTL